MFYYYKRTYLAKNRWIETYDIIFTNQLNPSLNIFLLQATITEKILRKIVFITKSPLRILDLEDTSKN